jgi:hypothetical protein
MKTTLFVACLAVLAQAASCFDVKVTATHNGQAVDPADIVLEAYEPSVHRLNRTTSGGIQPPPLPSRFKDRARLRDTSDNPDMKKRSIIYSTDWCGAHSATTTTNKITNVQGYFQVPSPTLRAGTAQPQYVGAWVGLDGYTWSSALLQAGTASAIATGETAYWAWFEWVPSASYNIPSFPVNPGDWIYVNILPLSSTSANVTIENYTHNYVYHIQLTNGQALGQIDAEWIIEDPYGSSGQEPFPEFGTVWFENVYATLHDGTQLDAATSSYIYLDSPSVCEAAEYSTYDFYAWSI